MEFEYTTTIFIEDSDLERMCNYVKSGWDFANAFYNVIGEYDDCDYYASDHIYDKVKEEVEKRIKKSEDKKIKLIREIEKVVDNDLIDSILFYMTEYKDVADYYFIADIFKNKCAYLALKIANELTEEDKED
jgi:predicted nucleic acid-binding protein